MGVWISPNRAAIIRLAGAVLNPHGSALAASYTTPEDATPGRAQTREAGASAALTIPANRRR